MKILISAGPTREKIDTVRYITNRSSGKMGYALAEAALQLGHDVILVSGIVNIQAPNGVKLIIVESAKDMAQAIKKEFSDCDLTIMTAAVADYRPKNIISGKLKKADGDLTIELERTEDILLSLGKIKRTNQIIVGFAAEAENIESYAKDKLNRKNLDWIVANDISSSNSGFEVDTNSVIMFSKSSERYAIPLSSKKEIAQKILEKIL